LPFPPLYYLYSTIWYKVMKSNQFNSILDECLERLLTKGETIEQCLASYPELAAELKPLLETALATKQASAIQPRPEFKARARYQFHSALQEAKSGRRLPVFGWLPGWATAVTIVLVLLLAGGGTVAAAGDSMPDEALYPVKIASEQVQLVFTTSPLDKAELYARLVDRRVDEIVYVAARGDARQVEMVSQRLNNHLVRIASLVSVPEEAGFLTAPAAEMDRGPQANGRGKLRRLLAGYAVSHPAKLRAVLAEVPEEARPALLRAIVLSEARYQQALAAIAD